MRHLDMGPDIANYLSTMHTLFGEGAPGASLDRPPLIAIPIKVLCLAFGDLTGAKVLGLLLSVAIGIPIYLLARPISSRWIAVAVTVGFVLTPAYSNMLSWGYITMTGILFAGLTLHFLLLLIEKPTVLRVILTGVSASLIVGFHQLSLAFCLPMFLVIVVVLLLFNRRPLLNSKWPMLAAIVIGVILSLPYIPVYLRLLHFESTTASSQAGPIALLEDNSGAILYLPYLGGIILTVALVAVALRWTKRGDKNTALTLVAMFSYSLVMSLFLLPPPFAELNRRAHYFMYIPLWLVGGVILSHFYAWRAELLPLSIRWLPRVATVILILALLSTSAALAQRQLQNGPKLYNYLDKTRWESIRWIEEKTDPEALVVTYPETLGWWVEAEARRRAVNVTERNMVPYALLGERSLLAERILSRNMGLDNGKMMLATTWPYAGAPGSPVLAAYVGGYYHQLLAFDDGQTCLTEGDSTTAVAEVTDRETTVTGDTESMTVTTSYRAFDVEVAQTFGINNQTQAATVSFRLHIDDTAPVHMRIPLIFCPEPMAISVDSDSHLVYTTQDLETPYDGIVSVDVTTRIDVRGGTAPLVEHEDGRIDVSFDMQSTEATIIFDLIITDPQISSASGITYFSVPQLIEDNSADYIAVDLNPPSRLWSDLPPALEQWLNACPYYRLVYSEGDIRIYEVDASALS